MVERPLVVRWIADRFLMVDPLNYFSFQPVLHNWCNKDRGMSYPVCGMVHIKELLVLIENSSPSYGSSEFFLVMCVLNVSLNVSNLPLYVTVIISLQL